MLPILLLHLRYVTVRNIAKYLHNQNNIKSIASKYFEIDDSISSIKQNNWNNKEMFNFEV